MVFACACFLLGCKRVSPMPCSRVLHGHASSGGFYSIVMSPEQTLILFISVYFCAMSHVDVHFFSQDFWKEKLRDIVLFFPWYYDGKDLLILPGRKPNYGVCPFEQFDEAVALYEDTRPIDRRTELRSVWGRYAIPLHHAQSDDAAYSAPYIRRTASPQF